MPPLYFNFELPEKEEGEKRLLFSFALVVLISSLILGHLITRNMLWRMLGAENATEELSPEEKEKIYDVLVEQQFINPDKKDEYKALSNRDSSGRGLRKNKDFIPFLHFVNLYLVVALSPHQNSNRKLNKPKKRISSKLEF